MCPIEDETLEVKRPHQV